MGKGVIILSSTAVLMAAVASLSWQSAVFSAESVSSTLELNGTARAACRIPDAPVLNVTNGNLSFVGTASQSAITLAALTNAASVANPATFSITFANVSCNGGAAISLTTNNGGITLNNVLAGNLTQSPADFTNFVDYSITWRWGTEQLGPFDARSIQSGGSVSRILQGTTHFVGNVEIDVTIPGGGKPLLAGPYQDTLIMKVSTNP